MTKDMYFQIDAFALSGRQMNYSNTQGVAQGYKLIGLSDRFLLNLNDIYN